MASKQDNTGTSSGIPVTLVSSGRVFGQPIPSDLFQSNEYDGRMMPTNSSLRQKPTTVIPESSNGNVDSNSISLCLDALDEALAVLGDEYKTEEYDSELYRAKLR